MALPKQLRFLLSLSIFQRIALSFSCILLLMVLLATGAELGLSQLVAKLAASQAISGDVRQVSAIDGQMASLQREVREFIDTGRPALLTEIDTANEAVKKNIGLASAAAAGSPRGAAFEDMAKAVDSYHDGFTKIVDVMKKRSDLVTAAHRARR